MWCERLHQTRICLYIWNPKKRDDKLDLRYFNDMRKSYFVIFWPRERKEIVELHDHALLLCFCCSYCLFADIEKPVAIWLPSSGYLSICHYVGLFNLVTSAETIKDDLQFFLWEDFLELQQNHFSPIRRKNHTGIISNLLRKYLYISETSSSAAYQIILDNILNMWSHFYWF